MKKSMFALFIKLFVFLILPFEIINLIYCHVELNYTDNGITKFRKVPKDIKVANLGSSHGSAFDYSEFPEYKSFNFYLPMQGINYDYHILNQYVEHMAQDSVLFVLVSFGEVEGIQPDFQYEKIKKRYYHFLKPANIENYNIFDAAKQFFFPIVCEAHPFKTIWDYYGPKYFGAKGSVETFPAENDEEAKLRHSEKIRNMITKDLVLHSFETMFPDCGEEGYKYNHDYLMKIISLCNEHKIYPVVVTCPVPDLTSEYYAETGFFEKYEDYKNVILSEAHQKGMNCAWYDYSRSPDFCHDYTNFKDISHMTPNGARAFTKDIMLKVKDQNILK